MARDQAAAQRQYQGSLVKAGAGSLVLSGDSTYRGPTLVDGGLLSVDGSLLSAVEVNAGGTLGRQQDRRPAGAAPAARWPGQLHRHPGGRRGPALRIRLDLRGGAFESASDRIVASGKASIAGGNVTPGHGNSPDLLSQSPGREPGRPPLRHPRRRRRHRRRFDAVLPNYLFLGGTLDYAANAIRLDIGRNARPSPASRRRQPGGGRWGRGNARRRQPGLRKPAPVGKRHNRPTGLPAIVREIYPALAACCSTTAAICATASANRLRQTSDGEAGGEAPRRLVQALGSWGKSADGYTRRLPAFGRRLPARRRQPGRQRHAPRPGGRLHNNSLNMDSSLQSSASIDSYHLGAYLGRQLQQWRLSLSAAHAWHRAEVKRAIRRRVWQAEGQARHRAASCSPRPPTRWVGAA